MPAAVGKQMRSIEEKLLNKLNEFNLANSKLEDKIDDVAKRYVNLRLDFQQKDILLNNEKRTE